MKVHEEVNKTNIELQQTLHQRKMKSDSIIVSTWHPTFLSKDPSQTSVTMLHVANYHLFRGVYGS